MQDIRRRAWLSGLLLYIKVAFELTAKGAVGSVFRLLSSLFGLEFPQAIIDRWCASPTSTSALHGPAFAYVNTLSGMCIKFYTLFELLD